MFPSTINFLMSSADMASRVFMPNMVKELGGSNFTVGLIVGVYSAMSFLAYYLFGRAADMYGRKIILKAGLLFSAISFLLQVSAHSQETLFLARALAGFTFGIAPAAIIAYIYEAKKSVGGYSSYGSLGWMVGAFLAGIIASHKGVFVLSSLMFFIAFLMSLRMGDIEGYRLHVPLFPTKLIRENSAIYVPYLLRHLGASITWTILPLYLVSLGASFFWVGMMYAINTGTQFFVMRRLEGTRDKALMDWGTILSALVFFGYALATSYLQVIPIQVLLGFAWSFLYVGSLRSLLKGNVEKATAAGLLNSTINLAGIIGPLLAGIITQVSSFKAAMIISGILCILGFAYRVKEEPLI
jgi:MFS family permease